MQPRTRISRRTLGAGAVALTGAGAAAAAGSGATAAAALPPGQRGTVVGGSAPSPALGEEIRYRAYLPAGYDRRRDRRYPVAYLLHGRGDDLDAWPRVAPIVDDLVRRGVLPPVILVMPDAPWSDGGSWYVDSDYTGVPAGRPVETALTRDLIAHVDATYRTLADRTHRVVGGYSMGGYGALRYALAHAELFCGGLVLSPAVYVPLPPVDSSAREFGAFGRGGARFVDDVYVRRNYPVLLDQVDPALPVRLFLAVGDDEWPNPSPEDAMHDLDLETAVVHNHAKRVAGVSSQLRVLDGGHDWPVWEPAFAEGLPYVLGATEAGLP